MCMRGLQCSRQAREAFVEKVKVQRSEGRSTADIFTQEAR